MKINSELNYLLTLLMNESWHPGEKHRDADLKKQNVLPVGISFTETDGK